MKDENSDSDDSDEQSPDLDPASAWLGNYFVYRPSTKWYLQNACVLERYATRPLFGNVNRTLWTPPNTQTFYLGNLW